MGVGLGEVRKQDESLAFGDRDFTRGNHDSDFKRRHFAAVENTEGKKTKIPQNVVNG